MKMVTSSMKKYHKLYEKNITMVIKSLLSALVLWALILVIGLKQSPS